MKNIDEITLTKELYENTIKYLFLKAENRSRPGKDKPKLKEDTPKNNGCSNITTVGIQTSRRHGISSSVLDIYYDNEQRAYKVSIDEKRLRFWKLFQDAFYYGEFEKTETIEDFLLDTVTQEEPQQIEYLEEVEEEDPFNTI